MAVRKAPSRPSRIAVRATHSAPARSKAKSVPSSKLKAKPAVKPRAKGGAKAAPKRGLKPIVKPAVKARAPAKATAKKTAKPTAKVPAKTAVKAAPKRGAAKPVSSRTARKAAPLKPASRKARSLKTPPATVAAPRAASLKAGPSKAPPLKAPPPKKQSPERQFAQHLIHAAQETKAERMLLFDLRGASPITDYVLIASGRSQGHVRGIADKIEQQMKKSGRYARGVEGFSEGSWILLDYDEVIVHLFHPETRLYYDLDSLLKSYPCETFAEPEERERATDDGDATP
jgi:ribosome-associated protein